MKKSHSWAITLLLAAMVPLATGCDECKVAKAQADKIEGITDSIVIARNSKELDYDTCMDMLNQAQAFYSDSEKGVKKFCEGDFCQAAKDLQSGGRRLATNLEEACKYVNLGGTHPGKGVLGDTNSPLTLKKLRDANTTIADMSKPGVSILGKACDDDEVSRRARRRRRRPVLKEEAPVPTPAPVSVPVPVVVPPVPPTVVPPVVTNPVNPGAFEKHDAPPKPDEVIDGGDGQKKDDSGSGSANLPPLPNPDAPKPKPKK